MTEPENYLRALERLMRAVKAAGAHDHPDVMPAYRACVNQLGYDPSKRQNHAIITQVPSSFTSSSASVLRAERFTPAPGDFFYLLNPEE